ncbi:unnamed protein product [marine sediment metagenome]|uniref:Uncharacterized protein n=1 Tax=marine sediment metagenome TaxID=412755 RepID=X1HEU5_9ZZZZ
MSVDEYDELLKEINREIKEKKFWRGKKWTKEQIRKMEMQDKARLEINQIKGGIELQREQMREQMGLTDTEGMTLTKENVKKLIDDLAGSRPYCGGILSNHVFYQDFSQLASALVEKYFTKGEKNES